MDRHLGPRIRALHWCVDQLMSDALAQMDLTAAQGRIMVFIAHRKEAPCSLDIANAFQLSHPTVSGLLGRLEKKKFIEFRPDPADRRCKRIYMLPRGERCSEQILLAIQENEKQLLQGFSLAERELFLDLLDRAVRNMGGTPCHPHNKEE